MIGELLSRIMGPGMYRFGGLMRGMKGCRRWRGWILWMRVVARMLSGLIEGGVRVGDVC